MGFLGINHVGIVVTDRARAEHFLTGVLGLQPHPQYPAWFLVGDCALHTILVPSAVRDASAFSHWPHPALQVDDLRDILRRLLEAGLRPYQLDFQLARRELLSLGDDLTWGLGTVFVNDPDDNLIEFVQMGHGIYGAERDPFPAASNAPSTETPRRGEQVPE